MSVNTTTEQNNAEEKQVNFREILRPYIKRWYWFGIGVFLMLFLSYLYLKTQHFIYETSGTVLIKDSKPSGGVGDFAILRDLSGLGKMNSDGIDNEIEIFKSKKLLKKVVQELGLEVNVLKEGKFKDDELYNEASPIIVKFLAEKKDAKFFEKPLRLNISGDKLTITSDEMDGTITTTFGKATNLPFCTIMILKNPNYDIKKTKDVRVNDVLLNIGSVDGRTQSYSKALNVALVNKDATIIKLSLNSHEPLKARNIINKMVDVYNQEAVNDKTSESKKTAEFINERIAEVGRDLSNVENEKERFKQSNKITDLVVESEINLKGSAEAKAKQIELTNQLEITNSLLNYVNKQGAYSVLPANVGLSDPSSAQAISSYNQMVLERDRLLQNATPQNPLVVDLSKQINAMRGGVVESLVKARSGVQQALSSYTIEKGQLDGKISKIPAQEKVFRGIERQQTIKETLYVLLLQKREETALSLAVTAPKARIVDEAFTNPNPVAPMVLFTLLFALILGCLLPIVLIYLLQLMDNKIKTKHDLEKLMNFKPVIGEIPSLTKGQPEVVQMNDVSPIAEAFRILVTNMNFMLPKNKDGKVIFVTSTVKGEGKTFISVNLALTLASPSKKAVIVGSDIRNPQLQRYDPKMKGAIGLTEYLYDSTTKIESVVHQSIFNPNLDVIYSGSIPPNPTELLMNGRYQELISQLQEKYDYVILDTAPLMLVTDSFLISDVADVTIYVSRSGYTEKQLIDFASKSVSSGKINNVGFVLNDVTRDNLGYGNKYGYGYSADERSNFQKFLDRIF